MLQRNFIKLWTYYLFFYYLLHMKMKKTLLGAFLGVFALAGFAVLPNLVSAQDGTDSTATDSTATDSTATDSTATDSTATATDTETTTQIDSVSTDPTVGGGTYGQNAQGSYGDWWNPDPDDNLVSGKGNQKLKGAAFLDTIRNAINWILGILATIALVVCLYGGFLMVTAAGDEKKYQKWLSVLKYAAVGLAIIGLSWLIVSVIFWFVGNLSKGNQTASQNVSNVAGTKWGADAWSLRSGGGTTNNNGGYQQQY